MLTDEEIQTIRLAKSAGPGHYEAAGNLEFAFHGAICEPFFLELNPAGLTIAAQAEEIERLRFMLKSLDEHANADMEALKKENDLLKSELMKTEPEDPCQFAPSENEKRLHAWKLKNGEG